MFNRYIHASKLEAVAGEFGVSAGQRLEWGHGGLVRPGTTRLAIVQGNPWELKMLRFGITPSWSAGQLDIIQARAEGKKNQSDDPYFRGANAIFMKRAFMKPLFRGRSAVIADTCLERGPGGVPYLYSENSIESIYSLLFFSTLDAYSKISLLIMDSIFPAKLANASLWVANFSYCIDFERNLKVSVRRISYVILCCNHILSYLKVCRNE